MVKRRGVLVAMAAWSVFAAAAWSQKETIPLWPHGDPEPTSFERPEYDPTTAANRIISGKVTTRLTNVSDPGMTIFMPDHEKATGVGVLVFPGGGYDHLAWNIEGTEVCEWFQSVGVTCAAVKYRVPEKGRFPENPADLEDAQQAMRLFRSHAKEWHVDQERVGVVGFSAGGNLAALLSRQYGYQAKSVPSSDVSARPNFQMLLYPGLPKPGVVDAASDAIQPNAETPPTFIVQAINDPAAHVENTLAYFAALKTAGTPSEVHLFAEGGHGFGLRPTRLPVSRWPELAATWLRTIRMIQSSESTP
jgi:acetyl esterase/lipase